MRSEIYKYVQDYKHCVCYGVTVGCLCWQEPYLVTSITLPSGINGRKLTLTFTKGVGIDEINVLTCVKPGTYTFVAVLNNNDRVM